MSSVEALHDQYSQELKGFGASLPDDLLQGLQGLSEIYDQSQLEQWVKIGVNLAHHSLRSWEATSEFFRVSPEMAKKLTFSELKQWSEIGTYLATDASLMSVAFIKGSPSALDSLNFADLDIWAKQGQRLCRGNWKSIALAALYFQQSASLLNVLSLELVDRLVEIIDQLTERSYELANSVLESSYDIFSNLAEEDREPFLLFAKSVTRASWADTRLYFERGPKLIENISPNERTIFLDLASKVTMDVGRQGFPLFVDAAQSLEEIPLEDQKALLLFATNIAPNSAIAAMEYLKSTPFVRSRLTTEQMERWSEVGVELLRMGNAEGAEAYFRLESSRAEEMLAALSARVELPSVSSMLRMYAKALSGEQVAVLSSEDLVDRNIGWISEAAPTTEGTTIYLPPFVNTFEEQGSNFQVYKVFTTHQTGRLEFGSFNYAFNLDGQHTESSAELRESDQLQNKLSSDAENTDEDSHAQTVSTEIQRYFNLFDDRLLISGIFTIVEDTRVGSYVDREYGGIRKWLQRLQNWEVDRRPEVRAMGLRQAVVENLLRASLGRPDTIRWPQDRYTTMQKGIRALQMVNLEHATVQDSAEVASALYDIAVLIPNVPLESADVEWEPPDEEMIQIAPDMPGGGEGGEAPMPASGDELDFENPEQPEFRGEFKPELVQLMMKLKDQQQGQTDGTASPLTKEQLMELLQNSVEITINEWAEGDLASSLGMFLDNLEKDAGTPAGEPKEQSGESGDERGGGDGGDDEELPVEIDWFYYDEWDFRASDYRPRWCRVGERLGDEGELDYYQDILQKHHGLVMETRRQFELMRPESFRKIKRLEDGHEIDLDEAIQFYVDKKAGVGPLARIYTRRNKIERDVAVAFLLDMSASTDEEIEKQRQKYQEEEEDFQDDPSKYFQWLAQRRARQAIEPPKRIIDLEKESTVLVVEALEAIGDSYGIYGFSGYGRDNVEFHVIKDLEEDFNDRVRKRIDKIDPVRSTRMGPAIRHTIQKLDDHDAKVKILIMVSDGRPQDHGYGRDRTEKEYAVHDTKQALNEAKRKGITPFLITVDKEGHDYLKQMCDDIGYEVVDNIESLPRRLPTLYRHLAAE